MKRLLILLLAASLSAQTVPKARPHVQSQQPQWHAMDPHGIYSAPRTAWESVRESLFGKLAWKHYKVSYLPLPGRLYCKVENMTHPIKYYDFEHAKFVEDFTHDPRNLVLTSTSFEFDAVAGDSISWKV